MFEAKKIAFLPLIAACAAFLVACDDGPARPATSAGQGTPTGTQTPTQVPQQPQQPQQPNQQRVCGNGVIEVGEQCDLGARNNQPGSGCSATCTVVGAGGGGQVGVCGNALLEQFEQCDLGAQNGVPGSGCSASCQIAVANGGGGGGVGYPVCGNAVAEYPSEQCDFGPYNGQPGSQCSRFCTVLPYPIY